MIRFGVGAGEVRGERVVRLLTADFVALEEDATLHLDGIEAWAAAIARVGAEAWRQYLGGRDRWTAAEAVESGLADRVVPRGFDEDAWLAGRSERALDSAAALLRARGGDALERAEFARLFATGEPRKGLQAFLEKRKPRW